MADNFSKNASFAPSLRLRAIVALVAGLCVAGFAVLVVLHHNHSALAATSKGTAFEFLSTATGPSAQPHHQAAQVPVTKVQNAQFTMTDTDKESMLSLNKEKSTTFRTPTGKNHAKRKLAAEGESCNGSLPPQYAVYCKTGLDCVTAKKNMLGASGVCTSSKKKGNVEDPRHTKPAPHHRAPVTYKAVPTGKHARKEDAGLASGADASRKEDWKVHKATYRALHPSSAQMKKAAKKEKKHKLPAPLKVVKEGAEKSNIQLKTAKQTSMLPARTQKKTETQRELPKWDGPGNGGDPPWADTDEKEEHRSTQNKQKKSKNLIIPKKMEAIKEVVAPIDRHIKEDVGSLKMNAEEATAILNKAVKKEMSRTSKQKDSSTKMENSNDEEKQDKLTLRDFDELFTSRRAKEDAEPAIDPQLASKLLLDHIRGDSDASGDASEDLEASLMTVLSEPTEFRP